MKFSIGDDVCIWGTRHDGCSGTVVKRDAAHRWYHVKVVDAAGKSRIAVLKAASLFPDVSQTIPSLQETRDFILSMTNHSETIELALALGVDVPSLTPMLRSPRSASLTPP